MSEEKKKEESKANKMETKTTNAMVINVDGEEGRVYKFLMPFHSPLKECYDAAINTANEIARLFKEAIDKQKEIADKKEEESKKEE